MAVTANDERRVRRFVDLHTGELDRPERFLDEITFWVKGERRIANPVSRDELTRAIIGLARAQKKPEEALASLAAAAVMRLVSQ